MMTHDELKEAIETGHKASTVLREVLLELNLNHHCPSADGFEGSNTFPDCGDCIYCLARKILGEPE